MTEDHGILVLYSGQLKTLAKEDYIAARTLYITFNLRPARVLALQALEKIIKAICLGNCVEITNDGHDIYRTYLERLVPLGVKLEDDCSNFLSSIGSEYNDVRYEMKPTTFVRSEVWLLDRCFFTFLRYSHWYCPNGVLHRDHQPLEREFGDLLKSTKPEDQSKKFHLTTETIVDGRTMDQIKNEFREYHVGNNTFWDSFPEEKGQIFQVLNKYIKGFGLLNRKPEAYNDKNVVKGIIDPPLGQPEALNQSFAPLSIQSSGGKPVNRPSEWSTYYDKVEYID